MMIQLLIRVMLIWAVITGATYLVSAIVSEVKQWATRRALRHVTPREIAELIRNNKGTITADELHAQTAMPRWVARVVLDELVDQKLLEEKYDKDKFGRRIRKFSLSVLPSNHQTHFQIQSPSEPKAKSSTLTDAEVIYWAVESKGCITPARLCLKSKVTVEEAAKRLDQLHMKGVFDLETNPDGGLFYRLTDSSLLEV